MLVNGVFFLRIVEFHRFIEQRGITELSYDGIHRKGHPHGVVRKIAVADRAVDDGSRRIAALILIGEHALHALPGELRIDRRETLRIACHIAVTVMAHTRPARAHIRGVFHPAVDEMIEAFPRRFDSDTAQHLAILFFHRGKLRSDGIRRRDDLRRIQRDAEDKMHSMALTRRERQGVFQREAQLFRIAVASRAAAVLTKCHRMLLIPVRTDESVASRIKARGLLRSGHIAPNVTVAL